MTGRRCPQCGTGNESETALGYSHEEWLLKQCAACGFVYLENPPAYEELEIDLAWERVGRKERQERVYRRSPLRSMASRTVRMLRSHLAVRANPLLRRVERWFPAGPVVDIGCGRGAKLASLPERFELVGIEISRDLAREARERLAARGGVVHQMPAIEGLESVPARSLAGIVANAFLEHEIRPRELLQAAARALSPAGAMIVKVPNYACVNRRVMGAGWCGFRFPGHVNYFTPGSLRRMVEASGMEVAEFRWVDRIPTSDNMWMVVRRSP
ncbi:MAG: class I SAM-dependent methyltransferase [Gammaproteobacteria bacterium]|nr:class I SAM-dependent methyltransferase [Gammaproteobacteria bacterium]